MKNIIHFRKTFLQYLLMYAVCYMVSVGSVWAQILQCQQPCGELINNNLSATVPSSFIGTTANFTLNVSSVFVASSSSSTYLQSNTTPCFTTTGVSPAIRVQIAKQSTFSVWYGFFTSASQCGSDVNAEVGNMVYNTAQSKLGGVTSFSISLSGLTAGTYKVIARVGSSISHSQYDELGTFTVTAPTTCSPTVSLLSPADGVTVTSGGSTTLNWSGNAGSGCTITGYQLQLIVGSNSLTPIDKSNTSEILTNITVSLSWRVRAKTGASNWGAWSSSRDVIVGSAPPTGCTISSLSPSSANMSSSGSGGNFTVNATSGQSWSANANNSWIFTNGSGTGSGNVSYSLDPNTGAARTGTITVTCGSSTQTFTVNQGGNSTPPTCTVSLGNTSSNIGANSGSSGSFNVTSSGTWNASTVATWLSVTENGSSVSFVANSANTSASTRNATIVVDCGGTTETHIVTQDGTAPPANSLTVSNSNVTFSSANVATQTITILSTNVNWTATESAAWISISPISGGNGSTTFSITVTVNTGSARGGGISISGGGFNLTVNVSQVANPGPICFNIGSVRVCADASSTVSPGVETLSGNIRVFLSGSSTTAAMTSTGTITINSNNATISGSGGLSIPNIAGYGMVQLIQGNFNFSVTQAQLNKNNAILNNLFALIGLPVEIEKIEVIMSGILLTGKITLPSIWKGAKAEITQISVTTNGIGVAAKTCLPNVGYGSFKLKEACLDFNTTQQPYRFRGNVKAGIGFIAGDVDGVAEIFYKNPLTELNYLSLSYTANIPKPLATTGLGLKKISGEVGNLSVIANTREPMYAQLMVDLVSLDPKKMLEFNDCRIRYNFGQSVVIAVDKLKMLNQTIASAQLTLTPQSADFRGYANLLGMLRGETRAILLRKPNLDIIFGCGIRGDFYVPSQEYQNTISVNTWLKPMWDGAVTYSSGRKLGSTFGLITYVGDNTTIQGGSFINISLGGLGNWNTQLGYGVIWGGGNNFSTSLFTDFNQVAKIQSQVSQLLAFHKKGRLHDFSTYAGGSALPPASYEYFEVEGNNREIIVGASGALMPSFDIEFPNGTIISSDNFQNYSNVGYIQITTDKTAYYFLKNVPSGTYKVHNFTGSTINVAKADKAPKIQISNITQANNSLNISWLDSYTNGTGKIKLAYDTDKEGYNGTVFAENILESEPTNQYTWNASDVPTGNYYIYAMVQSEDGQFSFHYGDKFCKIIHSQAPQAPSNLMVNVIPTDTLNLNWSASPTPKVTYRVYYTDKGNIGFNSSSFAVDTEVNTKLFNALALGKLYQFAITAVDSLGRQSDMSNVVSFNFVSTTQNNAPKFNSFNFPKIAKIGQQLTYQVNASDIDNNPITYSLFNAPNGMSISNSGLLSWLPSASNDSYNTVWVKITDSVGAKDSTFFDIRVYDDVSGLAMADFNKSLYQNYTDKAFVEIIDNNLDFSTTMRDSVQVKIYSNSDNLGINIWLREISDGSFRFQSPILFSNTASNANTRTIKTQAGDSIFVKYVDVNPSKIVVAFAYFQNFLANFKLAKTAICTGDKIQTLNKSWGDELTYSWKINGQEISTERHPELSFPNTLTGLAHTLSLIVTDAQGRTASKSQIIKISKIQNTYTKKDIACFGQVNGEIKLTLGGGIEPYTVNWEHNANLRNVLEINNLGKGIYKATVIDSTGCQKIETIEVFEPTQLQVSADTVHVSCYGNADGSINLKPTGGTLPYNFKWYKLNDTINIISTQEDLENLIHGGYTVHIADKNGCWIKRSYLIIEPQPLQVTLQIKGVSCLNASDGEVKTIVTGGRPPYTFEHITGQNTANAIGLMPTTSVQHHVLVKDSRGCSKVATAVIPLLPTSTATIATEPVCFGEKPILTFTYTGQVRPYTIKYTDDTQTFTIPNLTADNHEVTINNPVNGAIYKLTEVSYASGGVCKATTSGEAKIVIWDLPTVLKVETKPENCGNKNAKLWFEIPNQGQAPFLYSIDEGTNFRTEPKFDSLSKGRYSLLIKDFNGCEYTYTKDIEITELECPCTKIPNLITPNGDGKNDTFAPEVLNYYKKCIVTIYDRSGRIIFTSQAGYYPNAWDGKYNGADLPMDTYYYSIDLRNGSVPCKGFITLTR